MIAPAAVGCKPVLGRAVPFFPRQTFVECVEKPKPARDFNQFLLCSKPNRSIRIPHRYIP